MAGSWCDGAKEHLGATVLVVVSHVDSRDRDRCKGGAGYEMITHVYDLAMGMGLEGQITVRAVQDGLQYVEQLGLIPTYLGYLRACGSRMLSLCFNMCDQPGHGDACKVG